ncbi:MAG: hypothetical protein ACOH2L_14325 [Devosia sp.]
MPEARRRAAIGIFANSADLDAATLRLHDRGIDGYLSFQVEAGSSELEQGRGNPPLSPSTLDALRARFPHALVLRVDLTGGAKQDALVAQALLESAAQSVQLHDL